MNVGALQAIDTEMFSLAFNLGLKKRVNVKSRSFPAIYHRSSDLCLSTLNTA